MDSESSQRMQAAATDTTDQRCGLTSSSCSWRTSLRAACFTLASSSWAAAKAAPACRQGDAGSRRCGLRGSSRHRRRGGVLPRAPATAPIAG